MIVTNCFYLALFTDKRKQVFTCLLVFILGFLKVEGVYSSSCVNYHHRSELRDVRAHSVT